MTTIASRQIPFGKPWITDQDRDAVLRVLQGNILTHGPEGKAFEEEFSRFVGDGALSLSVSSCMAALHLAYLHFGIGPGDEVIVPAQTHTATVHAVEWVGARPVFVDCDPKTGNVTPEGIAAAVTPKTRALSVVHFLGVPCDMPRIMEIARAKNLKVIEDCAIALGARLGGRHVGLFGDAGCFSFYPVKHITTGEGGMFITRHAEVAKGVAALKAFGVDRSHGERSVPGIYDVTTLGLNYRMSELQAALGRTQLARFEESLALRRRNFEALTSALARIPHVRALGAVGPAASPSYYCLSAVLTGPLAARRNDIVAKLNAAGVGTSIYYPRPVPKFSYYRAKYGDGGRYPNAAEISDCSIALPVGPHIAPADVDYIAEQFRLAATP